MVNFKKIEMYGFKSFADPTEMVFDCDITSIVGPNGCGKSNVADAIRWVLGEQSAKQLRGEKMRDVIFMGTENRKSQSYCEVSLHFDNTNRIFNIDFDELILTRKLDKSGESEYQINRQRCLKRDITNILYDTGIGRDGYSIIGQGKGDKILSASSDERRQIFEEAAGISKFKSQKDETERNIEKTRMNLERINDIIDEMEKRLRPLEKQVEAKRKYDEIYNELKKLEINRFLYRYENSSSEREKITDKLVAAKKGIFEKDGELARANRDYDEARQKYSDIDESISSLHNKLTLLKVSQEKVMGDVRTFTARLEGMMDEEKRLKSDIHGLQERAETNERELIILSSTKEARMADIALKGKELHEAEEISGTLGKQLSSGEDQLAGATQQLQHSYEELMSIKQNLSQYKTLKEINTQRLETLKAELSKLKNALEENYTEHAVQEANVGKITNQKTLLVANYNEALQEKKDAQGSIQSYSEDILRLSTLKASIDAQLKNAEDAKNNYNAYQNAVKLLMRDAKADLEVASKIQGTVAEVINVPPEYAVAIDVTLGNSVQNIVTETDEDAKFLIYYLRQKGYGTLTFLPLNTIRARDLDMRLEAILEEPGIIGIAADLVDCEKKYRPLLSHLLGNTVVANNYETAVRMARKYRFQVKIVALDGNVVHSGGAMTGGSRKAESTSIMQQEKEISEFKIKSEDLRKKIAHVTRAKEAAEASLSGLDDQIQQFMEELNACNSDSEIAKKKRDMASASIADLEGQVAEKAAAVRELEDSVRDAAEKINAIDRMEAEVQKQKNMTSELSEKQRSEIGDAKKNKELYESQITTLRIEIATLNSEVDRMNSEINRIQLENRSNQETLFELSSKLRTVTAQIEIQQEKMKNTELSPEDLAKAKAIEEKIEDAGVQKRELNEKMTELEGKKSLLSEEIYNLREQAVKLENSFDKLDSDMMNLSDYILDEYGLEYDQAKEFRWEEFTMEGVDTQIKTLKAERTKLGDINHAALDEYEELMERYSQDVMQRDDLENAEKGLLKVLNELIQKMTMQFLDVFNQISVAFSEMFKLLFGGGKAELYLSNEEGQTPLDADIIIKASPKGKRLEYLSQLSGGERAMLVISILLAIIKVKPMPFCVLDEIEAPLDDTNCRIFGECLQSFAGQTQFVVITHKKPTMETAKALYGVTMEEFGVSKVVSVALADAVSYAMDDDSKPKQDDVVEALD